MKFSRRFLSFAAAVTTNVAFAQPIRFSEATQSREIRSVLPTDLGSAELERINPQILERATFSARVANAEYLQEIHDVTQDLIDGKIDDATARTRLKAKLVDLGYRPDPETAGSLTDFGSDARTNTVVAMNAGFAEGYGQFIQGQDEAILDQWPAQELYRVIEAKEPRNWAQRWTDAGGEIFDGRMIALKNDRVWERISRFGLPYPPFDYYRGPSHMDVRDVDRDTAIALGLIDRDTQIAPQTREFNSDLKVSPAIRAESLREALLDSSASDLPLEFDGDVLTIKS